MNSKFFDVNKEKQDNIINAAIKLFAKKGYKDASTDVIVKAAGISKGLLFHYFGNKIGLYEFICDYSVKYMTLELTRTVKPRETDFFAIMSMIESARGRVARNYPYMHQFLRSLKFEKDEEVVDIVERATKEMNTTYNNIYAQINPKKFIHPESCSDIIKMIEWINDGYIKEELLKDDADSDAMTEGFNFYLDMLRKHLYMSETDETLSVAKEEEYERNDSVMDSLRMEMTFEERLKAGKRPLVDGPVEEIEVIKPVSKIEELKVPGQSEDLDKTNEEEAADEEVAVTEEESAPVAVEEPKVEVAPVVVQTTIIREAPVIKADAKDSIDVIIKEAERNLVKLSEDNVG